MGQDAHIVLQKKKDQNWETIDTDFITGRSYDFFSFLSPSGRGFQGKYDGIGYENFPVDFEVTRTEDGQVYHGNYWMGDYGFGWVDLETFCNAPLPTIDLGDRYEVEKNGNGYTVTFQDPYEVDSYYTVRCLQTAFRFMYGTPIIGSVGAEDPWTSIRDYRIVYGFDS
jgi:hypothetical protein